MKLIDTDIAIDHFHGNQSAREFFTQTLASGEPLYISVVTMTELLAGMRPGEEELTERLLSLFTIIDVDNDIGNHSCFASSDHFPHTGRLADLTPPAFT